MKYCNVMLPDGIHLAAEKDGKLFDLSPLTMEELISGAEPGAYGDEIREPMFANVVKPEKLLCVGLNYKSHADRVSENFVRAESPILFSKFGNALVPSGADVELPAWEDSYDYEAELVIVIGKTAWNIDVTEAKEHIFGYTCGNDLSLRRAQKMTSQWLIGKSMPGFGPCGPFIVTADSFDPEDGKRIRSYVNGELRQDGSTSEMIFSCAEIVAFASKYIKLEPGDLIYTGTPSGVALEQKDAKWLKPGDLVEVDIEDIGRLVNRMV